MPEAKFRTVKRRETPLIKNSLSEFSDELRIREAELRAREAELELREAELLLAIAKAESAAHAPTPPVKLDAVSASVIEMPAPVPSASTVSEARSVSTTALAAKAEVKTEAKPKKKSKKDEETGFSLVVFWPIAVGLFLSGFAPEWQAIATQAGVGILRFTFPFAMLAAALHHQVGLDGHMIMALSPAIIYAQLPIDGILLSISLLRSKSLMTAIVQVTAIHAVCAFVLWMVQTGAK